VFDISFTELIFIGMVALIVIGPQRLPKVARTVGHLLGRAQRYVNDVKSDIQREVEIDELRKMKEEMESAARSIHGSLQETQDSLQDSLSSPLDEIKEGFDQLKDSQSQPSPASTAQISDSKAESKVSEPKP
jgi:sec-independent protein translocase protein TatB